jgi:hypothetical protein
MGERIRAFEWSRTPFGAIDAWSPALLRFAREAGVLSGSHGLTIMRERADAVGGTLTLVSQPGNGTKIEVRILVTQDKQITKMNGAGK